jgi:hypothetical protein
MQLAPGGKGIVETALEYGQLDDCTEKSPVVAPGNRRTPTLPELVNVAKRVAEGLPTKVGLNVN